MASRKDPVARARGKKAAPVKKPFPTGMVAGSSVLVLFLGGIIYYSATHVGIGGNGEAALIHRIGDVTHNKGLTANHIDGKFIDYPNEANTPPDGGNHNPTPQSCQVYTTAIANEHAVHSMEHGAVWVTYNPKTATKADITALSKLVTGNSFRMMSPYDNLKEPISLQAWGVRIFAKSASDKRIKEFLNGFTSGPQTQEVGAACVGTTDDKTTADAEFSGHSSSAGDPAGAAPPGSAPSATTTAVATLGSTKTSASPVATPSAATPSPQASATPVPSATK